MTDKILNKIVSEFAEGLLKKAKVTHAGNCLTMSQFLKPYLSGLFGIETLINNCKVKQGRKKVNNYYLIKIKNGVIIDATASQFKKPDGKQMPKVFIGQKPDWYECGGKS